MLSIMMKCQVVVGLCKYSHFLLAAKGVSSSSAVVIGGASAGGVVLLVASIVIAILLVLWRRNRIKLLGPSEAGRETADSKERQVYDHSKERCC